MNGAESVVCSLHAAGAEVCFANPGTSEMQFVDALDRTRLIRCVLGLFEGVVTGAADGYARMARKPAVTLLHLAPGFANGAANLHNARKARTPVLNLVGEHAVRHLDYDAPLSADISGAAAPFSDWVRTGTSAATLGQDAMAGWAAASSHPGAVATLILPADLGWDEGGVIAPPPVAAESRAIEESALSQAAQALGPGALLLVGGTVLEDPAAQVLAAGIAQATGATLMAPGSNRRVEMGAGLPVSTAHRLLTTLEQQGFAQFEPTGSAWHVGRDAFSTGMAYGRRLSFVAPALPLLRRLRCGADPLAPRRAGDQGRPPGGRKRALAGRP